MKPALLILLLTSATALPASAAERNTVAEQAQQAAAHLPRGCILTAEQTGDQAPLISVAGQQEPAGVPPEKIIFEIGSISKVFTGLLLAQAVLAKKVKLDSTLRDLMGPKQVFADDKVASITLLQLATHSSGLPRLPDNLRDEADEADPYAHYDRARLDAYVASAKLAHAAPFPEEYSNLGVGLLGDLLARLHGRSWEELVVERIARPLGLDDTRATLTAGQMKRLAPPYAGRERAHAWHQQALAGAGALHSTAADLLKFGHALRRPAASPLKAAIEMIEQPREGSQFGLCLGLAPRDGHHIYWNQGGTGGYTSWISADPTTERVLVMLINNNALLPEQVLSNKLPAAKSVPADPSLADYEGTYDTGVKAGRTAILYHFEARGSDLWMQITGQAAIKLQAHASTKDRFEFKPVKAEIQFTRKKGKVVSTTLFQSGLEIQAKKLVTNGKTR
ncbi:MAG: serine hydrolase domain-containing protein [Roseimicrobium sp.]